MIKLVKLITGEELVAEIKDGVENVELKNPVAFTLTQNGMRMIGYPLIPIEGNLVIDKKCIIYMVDVITEIVNGYNKQFGNGIVLANVSELSKLEG